MSKYIGNKCIVCEQEFCENDDIVVCPVCGTPYHRDCYNKIGECLNKEYHISGKSWKPDKKTESVIENKICPECGTENAPENINCIRCGAIIADDPTEQPDFNNNKRMHMGGFTFDPGDKYCGINPEEEFESVSLKELAEFVKSNQIYYLPIFKKFKDTGKKISLNITSFFFPEFYFANRKMWLWAVMSIIVSNIIKIPMIIYTLADIGLISGTKGFINIESQNFELMYNISYYANYIFRILVMLFANWMYYKHAIKKINRHKNAQENFGEDGLSAAGGTSFAGMFVSFSAELFIFTAITVLIMLCQ